MTTRLIFLNLPSSITAHELQSHIQAVPALESQITDVKLLFKKDGSSRRMAFVGFEAADDAKAVREYLDSTYLMGIKIKVDWAKAIEDKPPRKRQRLSPEPEIQQEEIPAEQPEQEDDDDDAAYLAKRKKKNIGESEPVPVVEEPQPEPEQPVEEEAPTTRLFIRNLPYSLLPAELSSFFAPLIPSLVHIVTDSKTQQSKGLAFVTFSSPAEATQALSYDKRDFKGRLIHIMPAIERAAPPEPMNNTFKSKKAAQLASEASSTTAAGFKWSSLYMNPDAVLDSVAARLGVQKSDIMDPTNEDSGVRLAIAEMSILEETRKYFEKNGVDLSTLETATPINGFDQRTLLIKNIPHSTSSSTLTALLQPHGSPTRFLLPPSGTICAVEFDTTDEARSALKGLSYKKVGDRPLYVQKAPKGFWKFEDASLQQSVEDKEAPASGGDRPVEEKTSLATHASVYVKNLAFTTTTALLQSTFEHLQGFTSALVRMKNDPADPSKRLSMGFGFLGFSTPENAEKALSIINGFKLQGHALQASLARRGEDEPSKSESTAQESTKLIIKNLPFECSKNDLSQLFKSFGPLKSVRVPKKVDKRSRGFGFVEFVSKGDAKSAIVGTRGVHLLGRRLVVSYEGTDKDGEQD